MLYTAQVTKPKEIPAVTHVDGSARMQTVNFKTNPHIYNLISEFEKITGIPLLINTSLNGSGEPIVEDDSDAFTFFYNNDVDILVLNGEIFFKEDVMQFAQKIDFA